MSKEILKVKYLRVSHRYFTPMTTAETKHCSVGYRKSFMWHTVWIHTLTGWSCLTKPTQKATYLEQGDPALSHGDLLSLFSSVCIDLSPQRLSLMWTNPWPQVNPTVLMFIYCSYSQICKTMIPFMQWRPWTSMTLETRKPKVIDILLHLQMSNETFTNSHWTVFFVCACVRTLLVLHPSRIGSTVAMTTCV